MEVTNIQKTEPKLEFDGVINNFQFERKTMWGLFIEIFFPFLSKKK